MKILVINGPNINMLGIREPDIYGTESYEGLCEMIKSHCAAKNIDVTLYQSNHEGDLVDRIQNAFFEKYDGIVLNAAAYTHTSVAILDALKAVKIPCVEVHISDPDTREAFRHVNFIREACVASVCGHGLPGYTEAIDLLEERYEN